ncbi:MAG: hypothetical protein AAF221_08385 [Pseudomonadota bacterium]
MVNNVSPNYAQTREYRFTIQPGTDYELDAKGEFWRIESLSVAGASIQLSFDGESSVSARIGTRGRRRRLGRIRAFSQVLITVVMQIGDDPIEGEVANVSIAGVTATFEENNGGADPLDVVINAGLSAIISPARASKRSVTIKNPIGNTSNFRVGTAPAANRGVEIEPGAGVTLSGSMAVSAYNAGAANEALTVTELDRL